MLQLLCFLYSPTGHFSHDIAPDVAENVPAWKPSKSAGIEKCRNGRNSHQKGLRGNDYAAESSILSRRQHFVP